MQLHTINLPFLNILVDGYKVQARIRVSEELKIIKSNLILTLIYPYQ